MRFERTGEFRVPQPGECFETPTYGPIRCGTERIRNHGEHWILRQITGSVDSPPEPPKDSIANTAINAVLDAKTLPEISDAVEALRKCWRPGE